VRVRERLVELDRALERTDRLVELTEVIVGLPEIEERLGALRIVLDDQEAAFQRLVGGADPQVALYGMRVQRKPTMLAVIVVVRVLDLALGALHRCLRRPYCRPTTRRVASTAARAPAASGATIRD